MSDLWSLKRDMKKMEHIINVRSEMETKEGKLFCFLFYISQVRWLFGRVGSGERNSTAPLADSPA